LINRALLSVFFGTCLVAAGLALTPSQNAIILLPHRLPFNPGRCTHIPGTSIKVGAGCLSTASLPTITNPINPVVNGADPTGLADSSSAFQTSINAGNVYFGTPGTYLINSNVEPPSNRVIVCGPGVTLKTTRHNGTVTGIIYNGGISNLTVAGCDFQGSNTGNGARFLDVNQGNFLIYLTDSSNILIEGNTFENTFANSAIQFATGATGPGVTNSTIQYNTFTGNPLYGAAVTSGANDTLQNNLVIDSVLGVEDDACPSAPIGNITLKNNMLKVVHGDCGVTSPPYSGCPPVAFITGGDYPPSCNYSTDVVTSNYCTGASAQRATIANDAPVGGQAAQYSNDILGPGCLCITDSSNC
jgi:hypothetical protein